MSENFQPGFQTVHAQISAFQSGVGQTTPYAIATVTRVQGPSAMSPGDKSIITEDGELIGLTGGNCVRKSIRTLGLKAIKQQRPRLMRSVPSTKVKTYVAEPDLDIYPSHCPSQSEVEVFIEPVIPKPIVGVLGEMELTHVVRDFLGAAEYALTEETDELSKAAFIVITTQGRGDQAALTAALETDCQHILFVASRKKAKHWRSKLLDQGFSEERLGCLISPAGLNIGAKGHARIAISIVAQIIELSQETASEQKIAL